MTDVLPGSSPATPAGTEAGGPLTPSHPTLGYEPAGPAAKVTARQARWGMIVLGAWLVGTVLLYNPLVQLPEWLGIGLWGTPVAPVPADWSDRAAWVQYAVTVGGYLGLALLLQALFLLPRGSLTLRLAPVGRPMRQALFVAVAAGAIAMLLCAGLLATVLEWAKWWSHGDGGVTLLGSEASAPSATVRPIHLVWLTMLALWLAWGWVFYRYARVRDHRTAAARITRALLAGTVLELLVAGPAHVWAVRKAAATADNCYCARGSYTGLVFGFTALVWLFGPGVFLLLLREKRRREEITAPPA